jgi:hypothetical protein
MNSIYIYHHLGMGDHILCNAIIRTYTEQYDKVYNFAKPRFANNVMYMYRDLSNVKIIPAEMVNVQTFMNFSPNNNYLILGHTAEYFEKFNNGIYKHFDEGFYIMANIPYSYKYDKFYLQRDLDSEKNTYYNILGLKDNEEYVFIHEDPDRNRLVKKEYINNKLKTIRSSDYKNINIFDFIYTIENAKEVHVMNSSFSCLIDTMQLKVNKLFLHEYMRNDMGINPNHQLKLDWKIIK